MIKKPLLAVEPKTITFPKYASPKLDGIRCLIVNGKAVSRSFKPIPNIYVRTKLEEAFKDIPYVLDGELILEGKPFNEISSAIMSFEGEPNFTFVVFDRIDDPNEGFEKRLFNLIRTPLPSFCTIVNNTFINNQEELTRYEEQCMQEGYEGVMLRSRDGIYKQGRSTPKEQILLKVKRFTDSEAEIVDILEQMQNTNEVEVNELGNNFRSKKKDNLIPKNTMGALLVKEVGTDVEFKIASGFTDAMRKDIWENKEKYIGKLVKFKYQGHGTVDKPRIPVFIGFRHEDDL